MHLGCNPGLGTVLEGKFLMSQLHYLKALVKEIEVMLEVDVVLMSEDMESHVFCRSFTNIYNFYMYL